MAVGVSSAVVPVLNELAADDALREMHLTLVHEMKLSADICDRLFAKKAITRDQLHELTSGLLSNKERKRRLLYYVMPDQGCYQGYQNLLRVLTESSQTSLAARLRRAYEAAKSNGMVERSPAVPEPAGEDSNVKTFKVIVLGDTGVGKTAFLTQYDKGIFVDNPVTTIGIDNYFVHMKYKGKCYRLHFWDTAGQETFRAITTQYVRESCGALVMYDVSRPATLASCAEWKKLIDDQIQFAIPVFLIANKIDTKVVFNGYKFSRENNFTGYFETSAKTGAGIDEAIQHMLRKIHEMVREDQSEIDRSINLEVKPLENKKQCPC